MSIRSSLEKAPIINNHAEALPEAAGETSADHQKETQSSSFFKRVVDKTKKDLLTWYPPLVLHHHPELREALSEISPTIKAALDIEEKVFDLTDTLFLNHTGE